MECLARRAGFFIAGLIVASVVVGLSGCGGKPSNDGILPQTGSNDGNLSISSKWQVDTVRTEGSSGSHSVLGRLADGSFVATFYDTLGGNNIYFGRQDPTGWQFTIVDQFGGSPSTLDMVVAANDDMMVSFHTGGNFGIAMSSDRGQNFTTTIVDGRPLAGTHADLAIAPNGSYFAVYQTCEGACNWQSLRQTIYATAAICAGNCSQAGNWTIDEMYVRGFSGFLPAGGFGSQVFFTLGSTQTENNPRVIMYEQHTNELVHFTHGGAYNGPSNWLRTSIDALGSAISDISVGQWGPRTAAAYYDDGNGDLKVAMQQDPSGSWTVELVDPIGNVGRFNSTAFDSQARIAITYYDKTNEALKIAYQQDGAWAKEGIFVGDSGGRYSSLQFITDANGVEVPVVLFQNTSGGDLMIARRLEALGSE